MGPGFRRDDDPLSREIRISVDNFGETLNGRADHTGDLHRLRLTVVLSQYRAYCRPRIVSSRLVSLGVDFIRFSGGPNLF